MPPTAPASTAEKPNLFGLDKAQIEGFLERYDAPRFHAGQIYRWLYEKREFSVDAWTDLPRPLRERLSEEATVDPGQLAQQVQAEDGTIKYRVALAGGGEVESVYMLHQERITLCISSQVGCALNCDFCLTAKMGLVRHLSTGEILGQIARIQQDRGLVDVSFNLVFMGMGEPLHNYDAVTAALRVLTDERGFGFSRRRITISTSGLAPAIERLANEPVRPRLAVSLNATTDELRDRLMPVNRKYPIARLLQACRVFTQGTRDRMSFEYVLLSGVNDSPEDLRRLVKIVTGLPAKVNLIPFNEVPGRLPYRAPTRERVIEFHQALRERDVPASIRWSRGADARAACGQLALENSSSSSTRDRQG